MFTLVVINININIMKQNVNKMRLVFLCIIACYFTSCVNTQNESVENLSLDEKIPIIISSNVLQTQSITRLNDTQFDEGDKIGLYVLKESESITVERYIDNYPFVSNGFQFLYDEQLYYPDRISPCKFIAYYPYKENAIPENSEKMSVEINADQSISENYYNSDFMVAKTSLLSPSYNNVLLEFEHQFSKIDLVIISELEEDLEILENNASIIIDNVFINADYDFDNQIIDNITSLNSVIPFGDWEVDKANKKLSGKQVILIPQNGSNIQFI